MDNFPSMFFGTGASAPKDAGQLKAIIKTALKNGIMGFDTAPSYKSEVLLAEALKEGMKENNISRDDIFIQTKIDAWQMQKGAVEVKNCVEKVLIDMGLDCIDSLLVHWPVPEYFDATWKAFVDMKKQKMVKYIGVCNVRKRQLLSFLNYDVMPEIVQIERNPLMTFVDEIKLCKQNNIFVQSYSPLCKMDNRIAESPVLYDLSHKYSKSIGQVVLRWHVDTGVSPIFTSTKAERVNEYSKIYDFSLTSDEVEKINGLNENYKMYLEAWACPGF